MLRDIVGGVIIVAGVVLTVTVAAGEAENPKEAFWWILGIICAFIGLLVFIVNLQS